MEKLTSKTKHTVKEGNHPHTSMIPKSAMVRKRETSNVRYWKYVLKLRNQEFAISEHMHIRAYSIYLLYQSIMVNANCKSTVDTQKRKSNPNNTKVRDQITGEEDKRGKKRKDLEKQIQNNSKNGNRYIHIDNYLKCKLIEFFNQETSIG